MSDKKKDPKKKESLPNNQPDNQKNLQQRHPFLRGNPNKQVPPKKNYSKLFILGVMILGGLFFLMLSSRPNRKTLLFLAILLS